MRVAMIAVSVVMPVLVTVPAVVMPVMVMIVSMLMVVIVGGGTLVLLSWRVFVLVAVLELTVAVGMGVHGRQAARVPPDGRSLAALRTEAGVRAPGGISS